MSDKISQIRSRLRFTSDEFKNIVNSDLVDLKWKTFQMIVTGLFLVIPALQDESADMRDIADRRLKELGIERSAGVLRTDRNQSEHQFRMAFMQRVLDGLIKIRWPNAIVAFSNPLKDLMDDNGVKMGAIEFILDCVSPPQSAPRAQYQDDNQTQPSGNSGSGEKRKISSAKSSVHPISPPLVVRSASGGSRRGADSISAAEDAGSNQDPMHSSRSAADTSLDSKIHGTRQHSNASDNGSLCVSLEILQFQNNQLTQALRSMMSAISYRDDIENQIDRTLCDLSLAIAEIAGQYGSERDATSTLRSNRDVGTSKRDSKPLEEAVAIDKSVAFSSTAPLWRSVRGRVDLLHQQWMDARKSCRDAVVAHIEVHPISSKLFCLGGAEHGNAASANHSSSRGSADDKKRKPFMTSLNEEDGEITDSGSKTFLNLSDIGPVSPNKQSARVSSARSVSSIGSRMSTATSQFGGVCKNASAGMVLRPVAPSTIRVYQMLGLRPPKSVMKRDEAMGDDSGAGVELDRHRIFQLQRDLVKFSRAAFQFCNELSDPTIKYSQKQQSVYDASIEIPQAKEACSFEVDSLLDLRHTSQRLLIDTAALAPIAPNNSEFPMASNLSGLDALIVEISEICSKSKHGSKIMQSESLTRAIDRAITEQAALVQCLHFADVHAKAAQNKEKKKKTAMEEFKITVNGVIDRCDVELKSMMEIVRHVIIETGRAENCMVELPTTTNVTKAHRSSKDTHTAVYPLDALSRGFLGAEVAAFVNSIRAFLNNFENIQSCLVTVRKHMKTSILKELEQLLC